VADINFLSDEQLTESLRESKKGLLYSGISAGVGGFLIFLPMISPYEVDDNSPIGQQLIGAEGMNKVIIGIGAGVLAGGTIASIVYLSRIGRIKSIINKKYPYLGSLNISPIVIFNNYAQSIGPGFTLTYYF